MPTQWSFNVFKRSSCSFFADLSLVVMPLVLSICFKSATVMLAISTFETFPELSFSNTSAMALLLFARSSFMAPSQYSFVLFVYRRGILSWSWRFSRRFSTCRTSFAASHLLERCRWIRLQSSFSFSTPVARVLQLCFLKSMIKARCVQRRKWFRDRKWSPTGNDPQIGPQMIPDRKWSPDWTANDPGKKAWNGVGVLMIVNWKILAVK